MSVPTYSNVFGETLCELVEKDRSIVAITAAMKKGTGLDRLAEQFPENFRDVGIAEQFAVGYAAGLAIEGMKPVVAIYSTFLQRAYDQIIHDVCIPNLPVTFAIDRVGLVGDGPTHHGVQTYNYLMAIPNMTVMAPCNENMLRHMLFTTLYGEHKGPTAICYPSVKGIGVPKALELKKIPHGSAELLKEGKDVLLIGLGTLVNDCVEAAEILYKDGYSATVIDARYAKPLDKDLIKKYSKKCGTVITAEESTKEGGFGCAVQCLLADEGMEVNIRRIGAPDCFVEHGPPDTLKEKYGLTAAYIAKAAKELLEGCQNESKQLGGFCEE